MLRAACAARSLPALDELCYRVDKRVAQIQRSLASGDETAVVGFLQFGTVGMAMFVAGVSLAITSLEGWILTPWLTSRASRTNEVGIFIGLIFWGFIWGIWGTLLAVPMYVLYEIALLVCARFLPDR